MSKAVSAYILACGMAMLACSRQPKPIEAFQATPNATAVTRPDASPVSQPATASPAPPAAAQAQPTAQTVPQVVVSDHTEGPFHVGGQTFTFVKHVQGVGGHTSGDDSTVEWWELRDAAGAVVYRREYPVAFENGTLAETEHVDARELKASFGQGILIEAGELPSAPNGGWWVQIFGLVNGKLTPLSGAMSTDGAFLGEKVESYQPSQTFHGQQLQTVSHDVLKFRVWTGNVSIIYSVLIDWIQGKVRPEWTCLGAQGQLSGCHYQIEADPIREKEMTFVRLFPEPENGSTPKHVVVKPDSKIDYLEAKAFVSWSADQENVSFGVSDPGKVWIHVKIDGQDGWISGEEDFDAVGLPQSG
jgi:hypothetical protein